MSAIFESKLSELGIVLDKTQKEQFVKFYELLVEWNNKFNLTTILEEKDVFLLHFYDSLCLSKSTDLNKNIELCDFGTGAGFPGIVLKIVYPNLKITLIDSLLKRVNYLNEIIKELEENRDKYVEENKFGSYMEAEGMIRGLKSIIGNIYQSFDNQEIYKSIEEKAANFLI